MVARWARRRWWVFVAVLVGLAGGLTGWVLLRPDPPAPGPRARPYLDYTGCLLTDAEGITGAAARPVWAGLQEASLATRAKVQYLALTGAGTVEEGLPILNGLAQGGCRLVFSAGELPNATLERGAPAFPAIRFVAVGGNAALANLRPLATGPADLVRQAVRALVEKGVADARGR